MSKTYEQPKVDWDKLKEKFDEYECGGSGEEKGI